MPQNNQETSFNKMELEISLDGNGCQNGATQERICTPVVLKQHIGQPESSCAPAETAEDSQAGTCFQGMEGLCAEERL